MTEYIKKDDALECCPMLVDRFGYLLDTSVEYDRISELEPEDVVPVVRCRDCRYSREPDRHSIAENAACEGVLICFVGYDHVCPSISNDVFVDGEHFCGFGEVRDD